MHMPQSQKQPEFIADAEMCGFLAGMLPAWPALFNRAKQWLLTRETQHRAAALGKQASHPAPRPQ
jgi:hypothetical protein